MTILIIHCWGLAQDDPPRRIGMFGRHIRRSACRSSSCGAYENVEDKAPGDEHMFSARSGRYGDASVNDKSSGERHWIIIIDRSSSVVMVHRP